MSYSATIKPDAIANLEKLTPAIRDRILRKIRWLVENFEQIEPQPLTGNLNGLFKLRVVDYRVIYSFDNTVKMITIHRVGHRREIYN